MLKAPFNMPFYRERWLSELLIYFGVVGLNGLTASNIFLSGRIRGADNCVLSQGQPWYQSFCLGGMARGGG